MLYQEIVLFWDSLILLTGLMASTNPQLHTTELNLVFMAQSPVQPGTR